ncbi:3'-5' ssDNA/RNA exonuclease TatD-like [Branchiostoma floridae x Branchiostoma belcheri]
MLPALVDIGANLTNRCFQRDLPAVLQRARDAGVHKIMVTGTSLRASREALKLAQAHPGALFSTAGVHPHDAKTWTDDSLQELEKLASRPECVAVGECGLDFNRNFSPQDQQKQVLERQVELACRLRKPLFLHEREAHQALVEILSRHRADLPVVVIHCFTGTAEEARAYLDMGFYIGLTGFLCKDKRPNGVQWMLQQQLIPLDRLMVESDAPYMYPNIRKLPKETQETITNFKTFNQENFQHCSYKRNEPCSVAVTAAVVAGCMGVAPEVVAQATTENATKVFSLG